MPELFCTESLGGRSATASLSESSVVDCEGRSLQAAQQSHFQLHAHPTLANTPSQASDGTNHRIVSQLKPPKAPKSSKAKAPRKAESLRAAPMTKAKAVSPQEHVSPAETSQGVKRVREGMSQVTEQPEKKAKSDRVSPNQPFINPLLAGLTRSCSPEDAQRVQIQSREVNESADDGTGQQERQAIRELESMDEMFDTVNQQKEDCRKLLLSHGPRGLHSENNQNAVPALRTQSTHLLDLEAVHGTISMRPFDRSQSQQKEASSTQLAGTIYHGSPERVETCASPHLQQIRNIENQRRNLDHGTVNEEMRLSQHERSNPSAVQHREVFMSLAHGRPPFQKVGSARKGIDVPQTHKDLYQRSEKDLHERSESLKLKSAATSPATLEHPSNHWPIQRSFEPSCQARNTGTSTNHAAQQCQPMRFHSEYLKQRDIAKMHSSAQPESHARCSTDSDVRYNVSRLPTQSARQISSTQSELAGNNSRAMQPSGNSAPDAISPFAQPSNQSIRRSAEVTHRQAADYVDRDGSRTTNDQTPQTLAPTQMFYPNSERSARGSQPMDLEMSHLQRAGAIPHSQDDSHLDRFITNARSQDLVPQGPASFGRQATQILQEDDSDLQNRRISPSGASISASAYEEKAAQGCHDEKRAQEQQEYATRVKAWMAHNNLTRDQAQHILDQHARNRQAANAQHEQAQQIGHEQIQHISLANEPIGRNSQSRSPQGDIMHHADSQPHLINHRQSDQNLPNQADQMLQRGYSCGQSQGIEPREDRWQPKAISNSDLRQVSNPVAFKRSSANLVDPEAAGISQHGAFSPCVQDRHHL